ncbi:hypothetical protein GCM10028792_34310 [Salinisphaera aquimarina]
MREAHRPDLVERRRLRELVRYVSLQTLSRFKPQIELPLTIDSINAYVVSPKAPTVRKCRKHIPEASVPLVTQQTDPPKGREFT